MQVRMEAGRWKLEEFGNLKISQFGNGEDAISFKKYAVRFKQLSIIMVLADFTDFADLFIHCTSYFLHCTFKI